MNAFALKCEMSISNKHGNTLCPLNRANIPVRTRSRILLCLMAEIGDALFIDCCSNGCKHTVNSYFIVCAIVYPLSLPPVVYARVLTVFYRVTVLDRYSPECV